MSLANHMANLGLSDSDLAAKLGVSPEVVRLWRHGHRRIPAACRADRNIRTTIGVPRHDFERPMKAFGNEPVA